MVVLVASLNCKDPQGLIEEMNLSQVQTILVNQSTQAQKAERVLESEFLLVQNTDRIGLSANRNDAIQLAPPGSLCQVTDDDIYFYEGFDQKLEEAYEIYPEADIIIFQVDFEAAKSRKSPLKPGRLSYLQAMKVSSVQMSFRRDSVVNAGLAFDEEFGAGATYQSGEENIFLFDALRKGLKIYSYPMTIALVKEGDSHWDRTITPDNCRRRGAVYYRLSKYWYWAIILQFAIRKRKLMGEMSIWDNLRYMFEGARDYKKTHE